MQYDSKSNLRSRQRKMTTTDVLLLLHFFFFLSTLTSASSDLTPPSSPTNTSSSSSSSSSSSQHHLFKDVLKAISIKQDWELERIRILSDVNVSSARFVTSQRYEFRIRVGKKSSIVVQFSDELDSWRKFKNKEKGQEGEPEFEFGQSLLNEVSYNTILSKFQLEGPFEMLNVDADHHFTLELPKNVTHTGLKRVLVGEGIMVEVEGAQEVSLFHASNFGLPINSSLNVGGGRNHFWPFRPSSCMPLSPIHIFGSASLVAYRIRNPDANMGTAFLSQGVIELLPEKCYSKHSYKKPVCPFNALNPRLALLEKFLKRYLGDRISENGMSGFRKTKIVMSTIVKFQLEVERDIGNDDSYWSTLEEWRTKPIVERVRFEVVARVEADRLEPVVIKKVRPFILRDTTAWSTLMSNISFTKFPAALVPPEALTLDVKW